MTELKANSWRPMTTPVDLKHLNKLQEELNECGAAVARCRMQGIDECEPETSKVNREWLEDEIADVIANIELVMTHFKLDIDRIRKRAEYTLLRDWFSKHNKI
jgi:hypothetical protein